MFLPFIVSQVQLGGAVRGSVLLTIPLNYSDAMQQHLNDGGKRNKK